MVDALARCAVNVEHIGDGAGRWRGGLRDCPLNKRNYLEKPDPPSQEGCHCDFIGGIEHNRLAASGFKRLPSEAQRRKAR